MLLSETNSMCSLERLHLWEWRISDLTSDLQRRVRSVRDRHLISSCRAETSCVSSFCWIIYISNRNILFYFLLLVLFFVSLSSAAAAAAVLRFNQNAWTSEWCRRSLDAFGPAQHPLWRSKRKRRQPFLCLLSQSMRLIDSSSQQIPSQDWSRLSLRIDLDHRRYRPTSKYDRLSSWVNYSNLFSRNATVEQHLPAMQATLHRPCQLHPLPKTFF